MWFKSYEHFSLSDGTLSRCPVFRDALKPEPLPVEPSGVPGHRTTKNINPPGQYWYSHGTRPQTKVMSIFHQLTTTGWTGASQSLVAGFAYQCLDNVKIYKYTKLDLPCGSRGMSILLKYLNRQEWCSAKYCHHFAYQWLDINIARKFAKFYPNLPCASS